MKGDGGMENKDDGPGNAKKPTNEADAAQPLMGKTQQQLEGISML